MWFTNGRLSRTGPDGETVHGDSGEFAQQDLRGVRADHHVAQEVGPRLGSGALLLARLPPIRADRCRPPTGGPDRGVAGARAVESTICPSEVARAEGSADWRTLMEPSRQAARRLVAAGRVEIVQGGRVVDPSQAKGPIRIRRAR